MDCLPSSVFCLNEHQTKQKLYEEFRTSTETRLLLLLLLLVLLLLLLLLLCVSSTRN